MENIHLLLLLRFFICDIKRELKKIKSSSSIRVYRAQLMSKEELDILIKFVGTFISINSFLSTSPNREQTRSFLISSALSTDLESVFIEIDANHQLDNNQHFGNITSYSYFPNKDEILFTMGSIFRLVHIDRDIDGIWNIQLILCSNKDQQLQTFIQHKKNELDIIETDLLSFGFVLEDMGKLDDAEIYYHRVLNQLSKDHEDIPRCYHALGEVTQKKGDYDSSLKWYKKSLEIDDSNIATSHNSIAVVYSKKGDYAHALESFSKALEIWKKTYGEDHPDVAMCFNNMGIIYQEEMKYSEALEYYHKAWNIRQKYLPTEHPSLGQSHACIGNVRYHLKHYDLALEHYNLALENFKTSLFSHHPDIAMVFRNIGLVYQDKGDFQQALLYVEKAATIYRHSLPVTHLDIIQIEQIIRKISSKL
jgi:tetratricopeptide (TPR) repeat protein